MDFNKIALKNDMLNPVYERNQIIINDIIDLVLFGFRFLYRTEEWITVGITDDCKSIALKSVKGKSYCAISTNWFYTTFHTSLPDRRFPSVS